MLRHHSRYLPWRQRSWRPGDYTAKRLVEQRRTRYRINSARSKPLIFGAAHLDGSSAITILAPVAFVAFKPFAHAAAVAHKNVGLLFLVSGINGHNFLFETLPVSGRLPAAV